MINTIRTYKEKIFYWLLAMVGISLPFPRYNLVSQFSIGLFLFWLFFYNPFAEKKQLLKQNKKSFLSIAVLYFLTIIGLIYTNNIQKGLWDLQLKIPLFVFPLILLSVSLKRVYLFTVIRFFSYSVIAASFLALLKAFYFKYNNWGSFLYYDKYSILLGKHSTYFALFIVVAVLSFLYEMLEKRKLNILKITAILYLFLILYLISNRISVLALGLSGSLLISNFYSSLLKWGSILLIILSMLLLYQTPNYQKRFTSHQKEEMRTDIELRKLQWKAVIETIYQEGLFLGTGTASDKNFLYEKYRTYGIKSAYKEKYNAHNQWLEFTLENGLIGLFVFMGSLIFIFTRLYKNKDFFAISIFVVFVIFMLTESIFERQSGLIFFSLLMSMFLNKNIKNG